MKKSLLYSILIVSLLAVTSAQRAHAGKPEQYGLRDGDTVSAIGSSDPDVYIVNDAGYKRLFLNPIIFGFYGHLGGFAKVARVDPWVRDAFVTSGLFRNCESGDPKVYGVEVTGEDTGILHWVNTTGSQAVLDDPFFFSKVFCINNREFSWYQQGYPYTSVRQVPDYSRNQNQSGLMIQVNSPIIAIQKESFSQSISAIGGSESYNWSITNGSLPPGLLFSTAVCITSPCQAPMSISGTPTKEGIFPLTIQVTSGQLIGIREIVIHVLPPG